MSWLYLLLAGLFEIGWPVGLKISQVPETRWVGIALLPEWPLSSSPVDQ
jgi:quaternary ammonium compound-resistance protein SugE